MPDPRIPYANDCLGPSRPASPASLPACFIFTFTVKSHPLCLFCSTLGEAWKRLELRSWPPADHVARAEPHKNRWDLSPLLPRTQLTTGSRFITSCLGLSVKLIEEAGTPFLLSPSPGRCMCCPASPGFVSTATWGWD